MREREPICGFCWAYREVRHPLDFKPSDGWWECSLCKAKIMCPTEDEESLRRDLLAMADDDPHRRAKTLRSQLEQAGGGGRSTGRRRKKPSKPKPGAAANGIDLALALYRKSV